MAISGLPKPIATRSGVLHLASDIIAVTKICNRGKVSCKKFVGVCSASPESPLNRLSQQCSREPIVKLPLSPPARRKTPGLPPRNLEFPKHMDHTKNYWQTPRSTPSTTRCPTTSTSHGQSRPYKPASTNFARNQ